MQQSNSLPPEQTAPAPVNAAQESSLNLSQVSIAGPENQTTRLEVDRHSLGIVAYQHYGQNTRMWVCHVKNFDYKELITDLKSLLDHKHNWRVLIVSPGYGDPEKRLPLKDNCALLKPAHLRDYLIKLGLLQSQVLVLCKPLKGRDRISVSLTNPTDTRAPRAVIRYSELRKEAIRINLATLKHDDLNLATPGAKGSTIDDDLHFDRLLGSMPRIDGI